MKALALLTAAAVTLAPPNRGSSNSTPHPWHSRAGGGAVHSIKSGPSASQQNCVLFDYLVGQCNE